MAFVSKEKWEKNFFKKLFSRITTVIYFIIQFQKFLSYIACIHIYKNLSCSTNCNPNWLYASISCGTTNGWEPIFNCSYSFLYHRSTFQLIGISKFIRFSQSKLIYWSRSDSRMQVAPSISNASIKTERLLSVNFFSINFPSFIFKWISIGNSSKLG